jgi:hypothetical protein
MWFSLGTGFNSYFRRANDASGKTILLLITLKFQRKGQKS